MSARPIFLFVLVALVPAALFAMRPAPWRPPFGSENLRKSVYSLCYRKDSSQAEGDACYGCFMRVTNGAMCNGTESLLADCANSHLKGTKFERCAVILEVTEDDDMNASSLCEFESCIRRVNMDVIIEECAEEMPEGATFASNYLNMTACILAKYRCRTVCNEQRRVLHPWWRGATARHGSPPHVRSAQRRMAIYRPIPPKMTHVRREIYGPRSLQALMVTDDYQLRITDVPGMMNGYECSMQEYHQPHMIQQAPWPSADCSEMTCQ
ncbi:hypothetical protein R5R35_014117 [Gryllus longicercus]|uniref:Odorant binding protein n=1 Tax=Gryllus longicercus TaxID=2509291 RepID=A0AAN9VCI7_9ORTH